MLAKRRVLHGKCSPHGLTLFSGESNEPGDICLIKENIILIDKHLVAFLRQPLPGCQFSLTGGVGRQQVSLMKPKRMIRDAQLARPFIKWRYAALILKNNLVHIDDNYSTKIQKQGQSVQARAPGASTDLFGMVSSTVPHENAFLKHKVH